MTAMLRILPKSHRVERPAVGFGIVAGLSAGIEQSRALQLALRPPMSKALAVTPNIHAPIGVRGTGIPACCRCCPDLP